jgi:hypothetical protein
MTTTCPQCKTVYDDAKCWTYCPHDRFISDEDAARKDAAFKILGKHVYFAGTPEKTYVVTSISGTGMVTLDTLSGEFAPHLFAEAL